MTWTPLAPQPVVLTTNLTAIVKYFASTTNSGFNWNTTTPTATIGFNNYLEFNTNTLAAVLPANYATAPGYEVDSYYWAATTNLYEFSFYPNNNAVSLVSNVTMYVDGQPLGNTTPGNTVPVRLATGAHLLTLRFAVTSNAFDQLVFVRDVNENYFYLPFQNWGSEGEYVVPRLSSLFTATNATPPTIASGPSATSSLNSNRVNFSVTAATGNAGPMTYTWAKVAGPDQGAITFSPNGTLGASNTVASFGNGQFDTEGKPGTYLVQVTVNDGTAVAIGQVQVTVDSNGKTITITPATVTVPANYPAIFQASIRDGFGNNLWPSPTNCTWSATAGTVASLGHSNGFGNALFAQYSAPTPGTYAVTASLSGASSGTAQALVVSNSPPVLGTTTCVLYQNNTLIYCTTSATDDKGADVTYTWIQVS